MLRRRCALLLALLLLCAWPCGALGLTQVMLVAEEKTAGLVMCAHLSLDVAEQRFTITQYDMTRVLGEDALLAGPDTHALLDTLSQAGYACDAYVRVDVRDIAPLLDMLGGVTLPLSGDDLAWLRTRAPGEAWPGEAGNHALSGAQFIWYLQRYMEDGKSETRRTAIFEAAVSLARGVAALPMFSQLQCFALAVETIDTDLSISQMAQMAYDLAALRYVPVQWMTDTADAR